jgi:hypothetical protein
LAALATAAFWFVWRQPTYLPPKGDEIDILLELAGVFPDNYKIMWREHQLLRATDPEAQTDPSILKDALFMHKLTTTEGGQAAGDISIEVSYWFYPTDHGMDPDSAMFGHDDLKVDELAADAAALGCWCDPVNEGSTLCQGRLAFGNYEFELDASYKRVQCNGPMDPKRYEEFKRTLHTADRLIALYLQPLRRKPAWL